MLKILLVLVSAMSCRIAIADLEPYRDYDISESVWSVSTIKVVSKRMSLVCVKLPVNA
jgi:hypothetical protein